MSSLFMEIERERVKKIVKKFSILISNGGGVAYLSQQKKPMLTHSIGGEFFFGAFRYVYSFKYVWIS